MNKRIATEVSVLCERTIATYIEKDKLYKGSFERSLTTWGNIAYFQRVTDLIAKYTTQKDRGLSTTTTLVNIFNYTTIYLQHRVAYDLPLIVLQDYVQNEESIQVIESYIHDTSQEQLVVLFEELIDKPEITKIIDFLRRLAAYWIVAVEDEQLQKELTLCARGLRRYHNDETDKITIPPRLYTQVFAGLCRDDMEIVLASALGKRALMRVLVSIHQGDTPKQSSVYGLARWVLAEVEGIDVFREMIQSAQALLHIEDTPLTRETIEAITRLVSFLNDMLLFDEETAKGFREIEKKGFTEIIENNKAQLERIVYKLHV